MGAGQPLRSDPGVRDAPGGSILPGAEARAIWGLGPKGLRLGQWSPREEEGKEIDFG